MSRGGVTWLVTSHHTTLIHHSAAVDVGGSINSVHTTHVPICVPTDSYAGGIETLTPVSMTCKYDGNEVMMNNMRLC